MRCGPRRPWYGVHVRLGGSLLSLLALVACTSSDSPSEKSPQPEAPAKTEDPKPAEPQAASGVDAERAAVEEMFFAYKKSILSQDAEEAAAVVSQKTFDYYDAMRKAALTRSAEETHAAPLMDRMMILMFRSRVERSDLEAFDGKGAFMLGVEKGWIGDDAAKLEPGEIRIDGDTARIGVTAGGQTGIPSTLGFRAYREEGRWKLDVMSIRDASEPVLANAMKQIDPDEDKALLKVLSMVAERELDDSIWEPLVEPAGNSPSPR